MRMYPTAIIMTAALSLAGCVTDGNTPAQQASAPALKVSQAAKKMAPAEAPSYPMGTKFVRAGSNGQTVAEVVSVADGAVGWLESTGCSWTAADVFTPATNWQDCGGSSGEAKVAAVEGSMWPLQVGAKASWKVAGNNWSTVRECKATEAVSIAVPAGTFDAFKVTCADSYGKRTWYYAPSVKAAVAYSRVHNRRGLEEHYELVELPIIPARS